MGGPRADRETLLRAPGDGVGRLSRIGLFSVAPWLLGSGAHVVGGGTLSVGGLALGAVVLILMSTWVSVRRCRFPLLVGLLGAEQVLLHLFFGAVESARMCMPGGSMPPGHAGSHGPSGLDVSAQAALHACIDGHAMSTSWLMVGAHVVATVLVSWVLARGEAWWWRTVAELARIVSARPTHRRSRPSRVVARPGCVVARLALATVSPRGPPLFS